MSEETQDQGTQETEGGPVINAIRKQHREAVQRAKELERQLEQHEAVQPVDTEAVQRQARLDAYAEVLEVPPAVRGLLGDHLPEGQEVTRETVAEAYSALGLGELGGQQTAEQQQRVQDLASVANLGNQVAAASQGEAGSSLSDKINTAETPEQLAQIMREAGQSS